MDTATRQERGRRGSRTGGRLTPDTVPEVCHRPGGLPALPCLAAKARVVGCLVHAHLGGDGPREPQDGDSDFCKSGFCFASLTRGKKRQLQRRLLRDFPFSFY